MDDTYARRWRNLDERSECLGTPFSTFFFYIFFLFLFSRALTKHFFDDVRGRGESFQGAEGLGDLLAQVFTRFHGFSGPNSHFLHFRARDPWGNNRLAEKCRKCGKSMIIVTKTGENQWKRVRKPSPTLWTPGKRVKTPSYQP